MQAETSKARVYTVCSDLSVRVFRFSQYLILYHSHRHCPLPGISYSVEYHRIVVRLASKVKNFLSQLISFHLMFTILIFSYVYNQHVLVTDPVS